MADRRFIADRRERAEDRAYEKQQIQREIDLEAVGMSSASATVVVSRGPVLPRDEDERVERDFERMRAEFDDLAFDLEGRA